jgi:hypothetical protein
MDDQNRWQPLGYSPTISVLNQWQLKSISLASVDTIHQTPCKHVKNLFVSVASVHGNGQETEIEYFSFLEETDSNVQI